jgi:hypothetical protein
MERDNRQTWKRRLGSMARSLDASAHVGDGAAAAIDEVPEQNRPPRRKGHLQRYIKRRKKHRPRQE